MGVKKNSAEINPKTHYGQVIYDKELKNIQWDFICSSSVKNTVGRLIGIALNL